MYINIHGLFSVTCTGAEEDKEETVEQSDQAQQESSQVRELWDGLDILGIRLSSSNA